MGVACGPLSVGLPVGAPESDPDTAGRHGDGQEDEEQEDDTSPGPPHTAGIRHKGAEALLQGVIYLFIYL